MTTMQNHFRDDLQAVRNLISQADMQPRSEAQIGMTMIAVDRLTELCERLYQRIIDLEKVQNERAND